MQCFLYLSCPHFVLVHKQVSTNNCFQDFQKFSQMTQHISICIQWSVFRILFFLILIYLTALGLNSSTLDLHCVRQDFLLQHMDSLVVARGFS